MGCFARKPPENTGIGEQKVNIDPDAKITLDKGLPFVLVQSAGRADDAGFEVTDSVELDNGAIAGKGAKVKASGGLTAQSSPQIGSYFPAASVDCVLLDLSEGGGIVFVGSASRTKTDGWQSA
jgi:hypothetical protein